LPAVRAEAGEDEASLRPVWLPGALGKFGGFDDRAEAAKPLFGMIARPKLKQAARIQRQRKGDT